MTPLLELLLQVGACPSLLIAVDFDGTVAPIVEHPSMAAMDAGAARALESLHRRPATSVAIVSGRGRRDLRDRLGNLLLDVPLVGSHGAEMHDGTLAGKHDELLRQVPDVTSTLRAIAHASPGAWVEVKPLGAALHVRHTEPTRAAEALAEARHAMERFEGLRTRLGMCVLDVSISTATKAGAVATIKHEMSADAVVFFGDDSTDEEVFVTLEPPNVGVRVGHGSTYADARVEGILDVVHALEFLDVVRAGTLAPVR